MLPFLMLACTPEAPPPAGGSDASVPSTAVPDPTGDTTTPTPPGETETTEVPASGPPGTPLVSDLPRNLAPTVDEVALAAHVAGLRQLGSALHPRRAAPDQDLVFSPWSLSLVLAMAYAGAESTTEAEMAAVCRFDLPEPDLHAAFDLVDVDSGGTSAPPVVTVDRPFLFAIVDGPTGALLFQGRIADPH
jgi:serpin B